METLEESLSDVIIEVGIGASQAIAHLGGYDAVRALSKASESDDSVVAMHGLYGIEQIKDPGCKPHLWRLLDSDKPGELRAAAANALAGMEPHGCIRDSIRRAMLEEENDALQLDFAGALMRMGEDASWMVFPKLKSTDAGIREAAAAAIGNYFTEDALALLRGLIEDPVADVRRAAWDSLARFCREGKIQALGKREKFPEYEEIIKTMQFENDHHSIAQVMDEKDI